MWPSSWSIRELILIVQDLGSLFVREVVALRRHVHWGRRATRHVVLLEHSQLATLRVHLASDACLCGVRLESSQSIACCNGAQASHFLFFAICRASCPAQLRLRPGSLGWHVLIYLSHALDFQELCVYGLCYQHISDVFTEVCWRGVMTNACGVGVAVLWEQYAFHRCDVDGLLLGTESALSDQRGRLCHHEYSRIMLNIIWSVQQRFWVTGGYDWAACTLWRVLCALGICFYSLEELVLAKYQRGWASNRVRVY